MERWAIALGQYRTSSYEVLDIAGDSSGVKTKQGCGGERLLKWNKGVLKKTSTLFKKVLMMIALPSFSSHSMYHPFSFKNT